MACPEGISIDAEAFSDTCTNRPDFLMDQLSQHPEQKPFWKIAVLLELDSMGMNIYIQRLGTY